MDTASAVWQLATCCRILENIAKMEGLRDVVMATSFGTKIAITGFV